MEITNIHTKWIQDALGVSTAVALRVQKEINENHDLDWSEADLDEIEFYALLVFENMNVTHIF
jgi:hypothetical protein